MEPIEEWRVLEDYNSYEVSNYGRIKNRAKSECLKPKVGRHGYYEVTLSHRSKLSYHLIHRLVATAFIPNPLNKPQVNHLGSKTDNKAWMLEWCTKEENAKHAHANIIKNTQKVAVQGIHKDGTTIQFESIADAAKHVNGVFSGISRCCSDTIGRYKTYKGYTWTSVVPKIVVPVHDLPGEIWICTKDSTYAQINKYDYWVSNMARVRNCNLKLRKLADRIQLKRPGHKKTMQIHRLVIMAFDVPNPEDKSEVDHIDGNHNNNSLNNLRWATGLENCNNPATVKKNPVRRISTDGAITDYISIKEALLDTGGASSSGICECIGGKFKTHCGYKWQRI
jgi:hypothetical protein